MDGDWVDGEGMPLVTASSPAAGQLELRLGLPPPVVDEPPIRYWRTSLAPGELEDLGSFDYGQHPEIFLGRIGLGPLRVGCDTNILIDILEHGHVAVEQLLADDEEVGERAWVADDEEIEALLTLLGLWTSRDIRFIFSERQASDHRTKGPGRLDVDERHGQLMELNAGWFHVIPNDPAQHPRGEIPRLEALPPNTDTELMALAVRAGCHVFLTRDRRVVKRVAKVRSIGLAVMLPTELLDELAFGGDLRTIGADGGICDDHKWVHLRRVVDPDYAG